MLVANPCDNPSVEFLIVLGKQPTLNKITLFEPQISMSTRFPFSSYILFPRMRGVTFNPYFIEDFMEDTH